LGKKKKEITGIVPLFGSNRMQAELPGQLLKGCRWIGIPCCGSLTELRYMQASTIVISDKHKHLINLCKTMADPQLGPALYRQLRRQSFNPEALAESQRWCRSFDPSDKIDLNAAFHYFITAWMGRSSQTGTGKEFHGKLPVRWIPSGGDSAVRFSGAVWSIRAWRNILARTNIICMDIFEFLDSAHNEPWAGLYIDPPWLDVGAKYLHKFGEQEHRALANLLLSKFFKARIVFRHGVHPLLEELYPKSVYHYHDVVSRTAGNNDQAEVLITRNCAALKAA